ncbi:MAG TPA: protein kinase, partial [Enhygromyxa sp.]|nr:protein kinase [Enhygromyxa sp.]
MPRAGSNFILVGTTPHPHEQAGIDFVREQLPKSLHARALIDMFEANTGRHYELDFVVIGYGAVFVVEMKDYEGRIEGDEHTWLLTRPGDSQPVMRDNPLSFTNHKCKVLRSKLDEYFRRRAREHRVPFVQPLIFLSNPSVDNRLTGAAKTAVVDRAQLIDALQHGRYPNANPRGWQPIDSRTRAHLEAALDNIGLRPRETQLLVNGFRLGSVIADGEAYQDRSATAENSQLRARARVYLVPQHTTVDERDRLRRAARREVQLLTSVHGHQNILSVSSFADDAPLGPTLLFDGFEGGVPLDVFLTHEAPSFDERVSIFRQLGNALGYCHRHEVIHGGLHPGAILVRRHDGEVQVRIFNFQLGEGRGATATSHRTLLSSDRDKVYQAPELAHDPRATSRMSDCYSLGAVGYLLFTGQPPASSYPAAVARVTRVGCLDPSQVVDDLPPPVVETICLATNNGPRDRYDSAVFMVENLVELLRKHNEDIEPESTKHVLQAEKDDLLHERYTVLRVLGYGASARVLEIEDGEDQRRYALKAARDPEQNERLDLEAEALRSFEHPRIVKLYDSFDIDGLRCLKLSLAGDTLLKLITEEGGLSYELALRYGEDLLDALEQIEEAGLLHRDIKPANLGVGASKGKKKHLTLFDFSLAAAPDDKLDIGTAAYRDPYLWAESRGRWDAAADRWSAAITLHEMLTGVRPHFVPEGASPLDPRVELVLAAERFDAARRDSLIEFFQRALARELGARFDSAREIKRAWSACFADARPTVTSTAPQPHLAPDVATELPSSDLASGPTEPTAGESAQEAPTVEPEIPSDDQIAKIQRTTPIRALPLSVRALNALDRAGLTRTEELLSLPNNRLSAIRGIGTKVAREILELRDRWRAILDDRDALEATHAEPFHDNYRGPERYLDSLDALPPVVLAALADAGLHTTGVLARAPRMQVEAVLARVDHTPTVLHEQLRKLELDDVTAPPATLEAWVAALDIDGKKVADLRLRHLFGLEPPFLGRLDVTIRDLAEQSNVTRQAATRNLADAIKRWSAQPWAPALRSLALQVVDNLAGVAPLPLAAQALQSLLPHDPETPESLSLARCAALLRVAVELGFDERERGLTLHRRTRGPEQAPPRVVLWLVSRPELWLNIDNLGRKADELAKRPVLAASGETERTLELVVQNTALSASEIGLPRLIDLAAWASRHAAASTRLE